MPLSAGIRNARLLVPIFFCSVYSSAAQPGAEPPLSRVCVTAHELLALRSARPAGARARTDLIQGPLTWRLLRGDDPDALLRLAQENQESFELHSRETTVPGYWHLGTAGGPDPKGAGLFQTRLRFPRTAEARCRDHLYFREVSSAAIVLWNGRVIGRIGRVGLTRRSEVGYLVPSIVRIPADLIHTENTLSLVVTNHHARAGGIHGVFLGTREAVERESARLLMYASAVAGLSGVAALLFLLLFFGNRTSPAYASFSALLVCLMARAVSAAGLIERAADGHWTDLRMLLEYLSGVSLTPAAFFWFLFFLFPQLRQARFGSVADRWARGCFLVGGWFTTAGGIALSSWFIADFDAASYGRFQPELVLGFLLPSVCFIFLTISLCVARKLPGARPVFVGASALCVAAAWDGYATMQGDVSSLYVPLGTTVLVLMFCLAPAQQFLLLHRKATATALTLQSSMAELRAEESRRAAFLNSYSHALIQPLRLLADTALARADRDPSPENWRCVEQSQHVLAPLERLHLWNRLQGTGAVLDSLSVTATVSVGAEIIRGLCGTRPLLSFQDGLPRVRGNAEWLQQLFTELAHNFQMHAPPDEIRISVTNAIGQVRVSIAARGLSSPPPLVDEIEEFGRGQESVGLGIGLAMIRRIVELHGSTLSITADRDRPACSTGTGCEYSFTLAVARLTRQERLVRIAEGYPALALGGSRKF